MNLQVPLAMIALLVSSMSANAALLFYESFDYNTGDLSTESSGAWSDTGTLIISPGMSYGSLATAGNSTFSDDDTSWVNIGTSFDGNLDNSDRLWFSVLANLDTIGGNADLGFSFGSDQGRDVNAVPLVTNNGGNGLGFRFKNGLQATAWSGGTASSATGASVSTDTTYLIVGEIIFGATGADADTINLYLPDTDLNLGGVVSTQTGTFDQTSFNIITFMNKADTAGDQIDEIRFGTLVTDVLVAVPEPSAAMLGGLGVLLLLRRRR